MSRLLTVFGATGAQGGALIRYVLNHDKLSQMYHIRGVTRDPSKSGAQDLVEAGAEIVKADMDDESSLQAAVAGSWGVFSMTNYWEKASAEGEIAQGKAIADAAVATGVRLLIWSSLPAISRLTNGQVTHLEQFDSKAAVEDYIRTLDIDSVFFMPGFFMQNYQTFLIPEKTNDGYSVNWISPPESSQPLIDIEDTGAYLLPVLLNPDDYKGKQLMASVEYLTMAEQAAQLAAVSGNKVQYNQLDLDRFLAIFPPHYRTRLEKQGNHDLTNVYYGDKGLAGIKWLKEAVEAAGGKLTSWKEFVHREKIAV